MSSHRSTSDHALDFGYWWKVIRIAMGSLPSNKKLFITTRELKKTQNTPVFNLYVSRANQRHLDCWRQVCRGLRPEFPAGFSWPGGSRVTERVQSLIQGCWANDPEKRPAVDHILNTLYQIESMVRCSRFMGLAWLVATIPHSCCFFCV